MLITATFKLLVVLATASFAAADTCPSCPFTVPVHGYKNAFVSLQGPNEAQENGPRTCL